MKKPIEKKDVPILNLLPETWEEFHAITHEMVMREDYFQYAGQLKDMINDYFKPAFEKCIKQCGSAFSSILTTEAEARIMCASLFVVIEALYEQKLRREEQDAKNVAYGPFHN